MELITNQNALTTATMLIMHFRQVRTYVHIGTVLVPFLLVATFYECLRISYMYVTRILFLVFTTGNSHIQRRYYCFSRYLHF